MNQEIIVERRVNNKWVTALSSLVHREKQVKESDLRGKNKKEQNKIIKSTDRKAGVSSNGSLAGTYNVGVRIKPYISAQVSIQDNLVTNLILGVGNPRADFCKNLVGNYFRVSFGYSNIKDGNFVMKRYLIFVGMVIKPPYFREGGQGTDQILYVPLVMSALPTKLINHKDSLPITWNAGDKVKDVLKKIFVDNKFSAIKQIEYFPKELGDSLLKADGVVDLYTSTLSEIDLMFRRKEGFGLYPNNLDKMQVATDEGLQSSLIGEKVTKTKNGKKVEKARAGLIYNQPFNKDYTMDKTSSWGGSYVSSFVKTKYAVVGLDNSVNIELALVLPNMIGSRYCVIQNVGDNIEILASLNTKHKTPKAFYVMRQDIFFSTWGDSKHSLTLLAETKMIEAKNITMIADLKSGE